MLKVAEMMTAEVMYGSSETSMQEMAQLMVNHAVDAIVIVAKQVAESETAIATAVGDLLPIGIVTAQDLVRGQVLGWDWQQTPARVLMQTLVGSVHPDDAVWMVQALMQQSQGSQVVVTGDRGELLGIVTQAALLQALSSGQSGETLAEPLEAGGQKSAVFSEQVADCAQRMHLELAERHRAELALQQSEATNRAIIQAIPDLLIRMDRQGTYQSMLSGSSVQVVLPPEPTSRPSVHDVLPEDLAAERLYYAEQALVTGTLQTYEQQIEIDGQWCYEEVRISPLTQTDVLVIIRDITDRKRSEAERQQVEIALKQSEAKHRALISALPDLIMRMSGEGIYLDFFSTNTFKVFGSGEIVGKTIFEQGLPFDLAQRRMGYIQQALQTGDLQLYDQEIEIDDEVRTEEVRIVVCSDNEVLVIVRDITDRKRSEAERQQAEAALQQLNQELESRVTQRTIELQQSEERFRHIFEQSPIGIALSDLEGRLTRVNSSLTQIIGYPESELLQCFVQDFFAVSRQQRRVEQIEQLLEQTLPVLSFEEQLVSQRGERIWVNFTSALILDNFARPAAMIHLIEDVSDRKQADEELSRTLQELSSFKYALDQAAIVAITDAQGVITCVNDRFCEISKYSSEELIGETHQLVNAGYHSKEFFAEIWQTISSGKTWRGEIQNRAKDRTYYWVDTTIVPFLDQTGKPWQYLAIRTDITARKWAELKAQLLKERLQFLLASSPAIIFTCETSRDYGTTFISENVQNLLGYEPLDFLKDSSFWLDHVHPDDLPHLLADLPNLFKQKHAIHEYRFLHRNGNYHWVRDEMRLICDPQGHPVELVGYLADISDRKQMELEVESLNKAMQNAMEGIAYLDPHGCYVSVNSAYAQICGYQPTEMLGMNWQKTVYPDDIPAMVVAYQTMLATGRVETETRGLRKDGSVFYKQVTMVLSLAANGQLDGHYCFLKDITDRKAVEETLKQQLAAIEAAIDGIAILTGDTYTYLNQAHLALFGYQHPEELIGQSWQVLYAAAELDRFQREVFPILWEQRHWQGEAIAVRQDGTTFTEGLSLTLTESGELICVCRDITAQKQVEEQIRQTNEQLILSNAELARATRLKDEFLANMSHELRTPLNAILGMAEGVQDEIFGTLNDRQKRAIKTIESSGQHLLELINDILDLAKVESGTLELQLTPIAVDYLCQSSLAFVRQQAAQKQIQLSAEIPTGLPKILVDERRMRQVLINLLNNAVKFTPGGGSAKLIVQTEFQPEQTFLLLSIADTGIGIAPEHLDRLFQSFVQIDSSLNRQYNGTGLGLSLVRRLTELHHGSVTVTSQVGEGSCFTVRLPYHYESQPVPLPATLTTQSNQATQPDPRPVDLSPATASPSAQRILLVEDNPANVATMSSYLSSRGYHLLFASNGEEAFTVAQATCPDLILMDIQMPKMDGLAAIRQIRAEPMLAKIPIIALTALAMSGDRERCIAAGANDYLSKPVPLKQLVASIRYLIGLNAKV
ncbi:PAS domain S-box protein [Pantanalinema rosaneae CENA516]|uniref:PAS domain S-box protein n=1 Tax=Pantanalinema rosaneae TaxID=1620701 RepID=UPI003D6F76B8